MKHNAKPFFSGLPVKLLTGAAVSAAAAVIGAGLVAWLIVFEKAGEQILDWSPYLILALASAAGAATSWKLIKENRLIVWLLHSGLLYCLLLLMALPAGGEYDGLGAGALAVVLGGGIVCVPAVFGNRSGGKIYRKSGFR